VDLNNFLASWSLQFDMVGRSARKIALVLWHVVCTSVNDADGPLQTCCIGMILGHPESDMVLCSVRNREVLFGGSLIISRGEPTTPP